MKIKKIIIARFGNYINTIRDTGNNLTEWIRNNVQPTAELTTTKKESNYCECFKDTASDLDLMNAARIRGYKFKTVVENI